MKFTFTYVPAEDENTDSGWCCVQHPRWFIQDASSYGGGYIIVEASHSPEEWKELCETDPRASEKYWSKQHGSTRTLVQAKELFISMMVKETAQ